MRIDDRQAIAESEQTLGGQPTALRVSLARLLKGGQCTRRDHQATPAAASASTSDPEPSVA